MKLRSVGVTEYKSIWNSGEFQIGDITCLVGKNEAGKTALLEALYRLNPLNDADARFDVTMEYPRSEVEDYRLAVEQRKRGHATVVEAKFALDPEELAAVEAKFGEGVLERPEVTLSRKYDNQIYVSLPIVEPAAVRSVVASAQLPSPLATDFSECQTMTQLERAIATTKSDDANAQHLARLKEAIAQVKTAQGLQRYVYETVLENRVPKFLYFDEYYEMTGLENIEALQQRVAQKQLKPSDHPLLGLVDLARLRLEDLVSPNRTQELKNQLEGAGNYLSKRILKYWSQNRHIRMVFDVRPGRPGDPPGMQQGTNIWAEVYDSKHLATTPVGVRSHGFVWFFSFLAWFTQEQRRNQPLILLLDEPGLTLHGKAQGDLLRFIEEELGEQHQVIYTTHSPFMVDARHWERVRIVQDRGMDEDALPREEDGTKVFTEVLQATEDSLFPLQGALGYEIQQTLFVGPYSLVVEGVSDLLYLQTMSGVLERRGRVGLSPKWVITPVGGSEKVPTFVALLGAQKGLTIATLLDLQKKDRQTIDDLYKRKLLEQKRVLTYARFTEATEADVEDMFGDTFYLELVNGEFGSVLERPLTVGDLPQGPPRVLARLEKLLGQKPLTGGVTFNHYRPARYMCEKIAALEPKLPAEALDRFEDAFGTLNAMLD